MMSTDGMELDSRGATVEVEIGDGTGRVETPGTNVVWCRLQGTPLMLQWLSDEPVPPEGARVMAQWVSSDSGDRSANLLRYPPSSDD